MKKIFFLVLASLLFVAAKSNAQGFHIIPKVGLNLSSLSNIDGSTIAGLNAGVSAEILFSERFGIEPGILFSMQGTKVDVTNIHLSYINIPIYAKYYLIKGFNVFAGPQVGLNVHAKQGGENVKDRFKKADFGLGFGVGYQFKWGLMLSANYNFGFVNVSKDTSTKNGVFQLNAGWRF
ncbi:porin family protein [uncultured Alistipes sp.]|jgi:hypothetical protein|uniref:porin family protein n=1 Tax=uncultured Alistipes sp. TaxID=538949 RepID=UPI0025DA2B0B|nr:porin family protein [uncultured Alistipes sp.]